MEEAENRGAGAPVVDHKEASVPAELQTLIDYDDYGLVKKALLREGTEEPLGFAFPLNDTDTKHLVVLADGHMLVVSPPMETSSMDVKGYQRHLGRDSETERYHPYTYSDLYTSTDKALAHHYERIGWVRADAKNYDDPKEFSEKFVTEAVKRATQTLSKHNLSTQPSQPSQEKIRIPQQLSGIVRRVPGRNH